MNTNFIHPTAIVEDTVELGRGNYVGPFCYITGNTKIGNNNRFEGYCSIGTPAEHREYFTSKVGKTIVGDDNTFREFVTINAGTEHTTILANNITMLRASHIGHDSVVEDKVTLSCNVLIGGHSYIMKGVNFGLGSICHQFSKIGAYSMVGMGSVVTKTSNIEPGGVYVGSPAKYLKQNIIGLSRNNVDDQALTLLREQHQSLIHTYTANARQ